MEYEIYDKKSNTVLEVEGDSFKEVEARMHNDEGQVFFTFNGTYEELQQVISFHLYEKE